MQNYAPFVAIYPTTEQFHGLAASFRAYITNDDVYWAQHGNADFSAALWADFCVCAQIARSVANFAPFMDQLNHREANQHKTDDELRDEHYMFVTDTVARAVKDVQTRCGPICPLQYFTCIANMLRQARTDATSSVQMPTELGAELAITQRILRGVNAVSVQLVHIEALREQYKVRQDAQFAASIAEQQHTSSRPDIHGPRQTNREPSGE
jgi:hypothetical protein